MADITISDATVSCAAGAVTTVAAALATRVLGTIQNTSQAVSLRVRFGADPTATNGFILPPGKAISHGGGVPGQGNNTDFYVGDVRVFNPSAKAVDVFVAQGQIP